MKVSTIASWAVVVLVTAAISWTTQAPASAQQPGVAGATRQAEVRTFPNRAFTRLKLDNLKWNATQGNKPGVPTAVLRGDPSKTGVYLTINRISAGVMSRTHSH